MYAGCWNFKTLKVSVAILNSIREETGSQWSLWSTGEIWSDRFADGYIVRAREFWTTWRRFMEDFGSPFRSELQLIKFWYNQWIRKDNSRGDIQRRSNLTKLSDLVICRFAYWWNVLSQWQATIKSNTKVPCGFWGWDYITTKDYWCRLNLISLLRVANYEEFSLWWIDWKAIGSEPGINLVKGGGKQGETVMLGENEM